MQLKQAIGARTAGKPANATERHWWVVSALVGARERLIAHRRQNVLAQVLPIKVVDVPAELELRLAQAYSTPRPATSGWTARPVDSSQLTALHEQLRDDGPLLPEVSCELSISSAVRGPLSFCIATISALVGLYFRFSCELSTS